MGGVAGVMLWLLRFWVWRERRRLLAGKLDARGRGRFGERVAEVFLRERGFGVVARNWRSPRDRRDEIDLVCRDGEVLVFVEVKTFGEGALKPGYFRVNERKRAALRRAVGVYLRRLGKERDLAWRLDVVEVEVLKGGGEVVRLFEGGRGRLRLGLKV